uniref:Large ribosomal subunit protein uL23c n=1 Tax=Halimeda minima TaxID=170427 RepID=A0A386AZ25_9CHLO|nr:ribosomal protein L23 [Halimeda minima]
MNPDFLKKPIITEKTTRLIEQKQYAFDVDLKLNKYQIKKIFEDYYGVAIKSIQTYKKKKIKRVILRFKKEISIFEQ